MMMRGCAGGNDSAGLCGRGYMMVMGSVVVRGYDGEEGVAVEYLDKEGVVMNMMVKGMSWRP
jgi:hypothetical protein